MDGQAIPLAKHESSLKSFGLKGIDVPTGPTPRYGVIFQVIIHETKGNFNQIV